MTTTVKAVYEAGVLRPLEPVNLREGAEANITIELLQRPASSNPNWVNEFLAEVEALYEPMGQIDTAGLDHDKILYGEHGAR